MSLDQLDAPLRMTWSLDGGLEPDRQLQLAERLGDAGLFYLSLTGSPLESPVLPEIIACLAERGLQVSLVARPSDWPQNTASGWPLVEVMLDLGPHTDPCVYDWSGIGQTVRSLRVSGYPVGLQLLPLRPSLKTLPEVFHHAAEFEVDHVALPNIPVADLNLDDIDPWLLRASDLKRFSSLWSGLDPEPSVPAGLVVHDLFLWEILCPGQDRDHYSGCQAGNSLGHLDARGMLHPCSSWNQPMGSLFDATVAEFWQRDVRHAVREEISRHPEGCKGCSAYARCFAGCRGLSRDFAAEDKDRCGQDLMCPDLL